MVRQNWVKTGQLAKEISGIKELSLEASNLSELLLRRAPKAAKPRESIA
jgi:hypothetical protein